MKMIEQWNIKPLLLPKASEYLEDLSDLRFADSGIFSYAVQKNEEKLIFTADCQIPDELPERLIIRWFDSGYEARTVVVKADN